MDHYGYNGSVTDHEYEAALTNATDELNRLLNLRDRIELLEKQRSSPQSSTVETPLLFKEQTIRLADPGSSVLLEGWSIASIVLTVKNTSTDILPYLTNT